jgi:hypothetical protein
LTRRHGELWFRDAAGPNSLDWRRGICRPPQGGYRRDTAATGSHVFVEADQFAGAGATWSDSEVTLQPAGLSYSIVGFNVGLDEPSIVTVGGAMSNLWLGVSDYDTGTWHWLGGAHEAGWNEELPANGQNGRGTTSRVRRTAPMRPRLLP